MVSVYQHPVTSRFEGLENAGEMPVWDQRLETLSLWAVEEAGFQMESGSPCGPALMLRERVAVRPEALKAAWKQGRALGKSCHFVLDGQLGEFLRTLPSASSGPVLSYLHDAEDWSDVHSWVTVELAGEEKVLDLALRDQDVALAVSDRLFLPIDHWVDLLWANLLGLGPRVWGLTVGRPAPLALLRLCWAALRACSLRHEKIGAKLTVLGAGARIHPSAVVEASVLGKGAVVGPGAVVRGSILGPGATVEALAVCEGAVVGRNALVQRQALLKFSVLGEAAAVGGATQLSVLGSASGIKRGAYGMDQSFAGAVQYLQGEGLMEAPLGLLGVCMGERSQLGAGVSLAPGRVLPVGAFVVSDAISKPGSHTNQVLRLVNGALEPIE